MLLKLFIMLQSISNLIKGSYNLIITIDSYVHQFVLHSQTAFAGVGGKKRCNASKGLLIGADRSSP